MRHGSRRTVVILIIAGLALAACTRTTPVASTSAVKAAQVDSVDGSKVKRVTLTEQAVQRLAIQTAAVTESRVRPPGGGRSALRKVVPYGAMLYDVDGNTWVFAVTAPRSYLRLPVTVDYVEGEQAVLTDGPSPGTLVVTVGAAALYGTELGVGK